MKTFEWNPEKNEILIQERGISFEEILSKIENHGYIALYDHPNTTKYPNQKIMVVDLDGYAYLVPMVPTHTGWFLKTIIPSRKATRDFIGGINES